MATKAELIQSVDSLCDQNAKLQETLQEAQRDYEREVTALRSENRILKSRTEELDKSLDRAQGDLVYTRTRIVAAVESAMFSKYNANKYVDEKGSEEEPEELRLLRFILTLAE